MNKRIDKFLSTQKEPQIKRKALGVAARLIIVIAALSPASTIANVNHHKTASLTDPATIQSVRIKHGKTIEKYSNGLIVKIDPKGNRKEIFKSEEYVFEATVPSEYGKESSAIVDDFIDTLLLFGLQDGKCSPQHQSRLYQFANYYLSINEPKKAAPLILRYIEIKREIHENGAPLSDAEKIYLTALETVSARNHLFDSRRRPNSFVLVKDTEQRVFLGLLYFGIPNNIRIHRRRSVDNSRHAGHRPALFMEIVEVFFQTSYCRLIPASSLSTSNPTNA